MDISEILNKANLSNGACRADVINLFLNTEGGLTEKEAQKKLGNKYDRTSIYRTFRKLIAHHVIHSVKVQGELKYILSKTSDKPIGNHHIHFLCTKCQKVLCVPTGNVLDLKAMEGFSIKDYTVTLSGICKKCNHA
jgi:Fur family ferric uptake transcriptional regulator